MVARRKFRIVTRSIMAGDRDGAHAGTGLVYRRQWGGQKAGMFDIVSSEDALR